MDALSDVLRVFMLDGGVFLDAHFTAPWAVLSQVEPRDLRNALPRSAHVLAFHYVALGRAVLTLDGRAPVALQAGEIVLLPRNDMHTIGSATGLAPVNAGPFVVPPPPGASMAQLRLGGGGEPTQLVCGYIGCESSRHPLISALPAVMTLNVRQWAAGAWIETLFRYAAQETAARRPGSESSLSKLSELLFVEAVRRHLEAVPGERRGWLAGLMDPAVGRALGLIHGQPAHGWTVEALADACHLSRSAFAEKFASLVGMTPLGYLVAWRMQLARRALRQGHSIAQVAGQIGYASEAAFSRAFKREVGCAPATWRQMG